MLLIKLNNGKLQGCLAVPFMQNLDEHLKRLQEYETAMLVVYNTEENYKIMLDNWEKLVNFKKQFNIYFINPFSARDRQWGIYPYTHQLITQGEGLKIGLDALKGNVDMITKEEVLAKIKQGNMQKNK